MNNTTQSAATAGLPASVKNKIQLTYAVPNILIKREDSNGFPLLQIRIGGSRQIEHTVSIEYSEKELDESDQLFLIKAKNKINFGNGTIEVLNDAISGDSPMAASSPTATDYMNNVGKQVLISFSCNPDRQTSGLLKKQVFRIVRSKIVLP